MNSCVCNLKVFCWVKFPPGAPCVNALQQRHSYYSLSLTDMLQHDVIMYYSLNKNLNKHSIVIPFPTWCFMLREKPAAFSRRDLSGFIRNWWNWQCGKFIHNHFFSNKHIRNTENLFQRMFRWIVHYFETIVKYLISTNNMRANEHWYI